jgi:Protein of unknown function (DUF2442)
MDIPCVIAVEVPEPYVLHVTFRDGKRRRVDMKDQLKGEMFEPLRDPKFYAQGVSRSAMAYARLAQWRRSRARMAVRARP